MGIEDQEKNEQQDEKPVVQEHINPKFKKKLKKVLEVAALALVAGVVFGLSARLIFNVTGDSFFRSEDEHKEAENAGKRNEVNLWPTADSVPTTRPTQAETEKQAVSLSDNLTSDKKNTVTVAQTTVTEIPENDKTNDGKTDAGQPGKDKGTENDGKSDGVSDKAEITGAGPENANAAPGENTDPSGTEGMPEEGEKVSLVEINPRHDDNENEEIQNPDETQNNPQKNGEDDIDPAEGEGSGDALTGDGETGQGETSAESGETTEKADANPLMAANSLEGYRQLMDELHQVSSEAEKSLVMVKGITSIVNWMGETVETSNDAVGVLVADNGIELLSVTYYDKIKAADRIEVTINSGESYDATLLAYDESFNMAVVAIPMKTIPKFILDELSMVTFGNTDSMYAGMPIIAIGSPNGNNGSVEYGYVTGCGPEFYVVDGVCNLFTTDFSHSEASEGLVLNLDGELIGVISRGTAASQLTGTGTGITVESLVQVAECLCNGTKRPHIGVIAENIPDSALKELKLEHGIYVNEVETVSPAANAEIHKGDIILSVNGTDIDSVEAFSSLLMQNNSNSEMEILLYRSSRKGEPELKVKVIPD